VDSGFSSLLYRLHLTGDASVPGSVIAKLPAQSEARGAMDMMGGYARELAFYQRVAGRAPLGTPRVYAARMATDSTDFVLVLEDLGDWDNADHLAGLSLERVRLGIAQLAGLHAWSTDPSNADALNAFPSLGNQMTREVFPAVFARGLAGVPRTRSGTSDACSRQLCRTFRRPRGDCAAGVGRTLDAGARRHQGRQHVVHRRRRPGHGGTHQARVKAMSALAGNGSKLFEPADHFVERADGR
jgi:Ecdysteroid kinase-like family